MSKHDPVNQKIKKAISFETASYLKWLVNSLNSDSLLIPDILPTDF